MILSFGYTTAALLAGVKTVTRRDWKPRTLDSYRQALVTGNTVDGYNTSPRVGGTWIAVVKLKGIAVEPISAMPDSDYEAEGFAWLHARGQRPPKSAPFPDFSRGSFDAWRASGATVTVVRFKLVHLTAPGAVLARQLGLEDVP